METMQEALPGTAEAERTLCRVVMTLGVPSYAIWRTLEESGAIQYRLLNLHRRLPEAPRIR